MRTNSDPEDDLFIPEREIDWSVARPNWLARRPGEKIEIRIDGAVGYSLRLIPSNKILARFASTLEAWPAIIETIEGGRSARTLALDWNAADGRSGTILAGKRIEWYARWHNGEPIAYPSPATPSASRRVAERIA